MKSATKSAPKEAKDRPSPARVYEMLRDASGHRGWWPGDGAFEICVGAILTQNISWRNVELALQNLKAVEAFDPRSMHALPADRLAELIRPSGYFRVKAARLRHFLDHLATHYGYDLDRMLRGRESAAVRVELLGINGIGKETADSMLNYATGTAIFVVDAYTKRMAYRMGWQQTEAVDYDALQAFFHAALPDFDADQLGDFHAQIVHLGKDFCRKRDPRCRLCPLLAVCPRIGLPPHEKTNSIRPGPNATGATCHERQRHDVR